MERRAASNDRSVVPTSRLAVLPLADFAVERRMTQYILRRLIQSLFIIWGCATLVFFMLRLIPGDPVVQMLGPEYTPEAAEALRAQARARPAAAHPVRALVRQRADRRSGRLDRLRRDGVGAIATGLPKTLSLAALSFLIALVIAVPAGIIAALRRNTVFDYAASIVAFVGVSMPSFWFGIILILIFAVRLRWLPAIGYAEIAEDGVGEWLQAADPAQPGHRRRLLRDPDALRPRRAARGARQRLRATARAKGCASGLSSCVTPCATR